MVGALTLHHRLRKSALLSEPEIALPSEIVDRVFAKEFRCDPLRRCFVGDCFGAVLAKLRHLPVVVGTRPGATLAIESRFFVDVQERLEPTCNSHFANREAGRLIHRRQSGRDRRRLANLRVRF